MNKKVLTLCASFLLAGGLTSSALAQGEVTATQTSIKEAAENPNQYYYVFIEPYMDAGGSVKNAIQTGTGVPGSTDPTNGLTSSKVLDVNGTTDDSTVRTSHEQNRSTWWRVEPVKETVNNTEVIIGYRLINALTGKPLSVTTSDGTVYNIFEGEFTSQLGLLKFVTETGVNLYYKGSDTEVAQGGDANAYQYEMISINPEALTKDELNRVNNGYFGLQFGYIDQATKAYVNYEGLQGVDPFVGQLVAKTTSFGSNNQGTASKEIKPETGSYFIYNETADAYVVLLKDKWSMNNTNHDPNEAGNGHKFALMTAKEIIEDQLQADPKARKIATWSFNVNMPVVVDYSPLEVVAVKAYTNKDKSETTTTDLEMYIANMGGINYLTTTKAEDATLSPANDKLVAVDPVNTVVRFGMTDYIDMSEFYGWAITIKGLAGTGVEGMTVRPDIKVQTNIEDEDAVWTKADYVAFSRPEAHWIVTSQNGTIVLTNRETKATLRWDEAFDMLGNGSLALRKESENIYVNGNYKFEIKKVKELGKDSWDDYGLYYQDDSEIGKYRTYKVTFSDAFGTTSYVGIDGKGNVELTRDEAAAINFDVVRTQTTDTLNNDGTVAENVKKDYFQIYNNIMAKNKDGEWEFKANGDTLSFYRYKLAYGDKFLTYNDAKKQFELIEEDVVYTNSTAPDNVADKVVDYGKSTLADNFIVKLKENDKVNIVKVANYEMEDIVAGTYHATYDDATTDTEYYVVKLGEKLIEVKEGKPLNETQKEKYLMFVDELDGQDWPNCFEGENVLANGEMMFFDFNNKEVQEQENIYAWNANAQLTMVKDEDNSYRYFATPDTMEFYRVEFDDEFLFERGKDGINFLGLTYDRKNYNPAIYVDTAYIQNTNKPTYLLAVDPTIEPSHKYCPTHGIDPDASVCVPEHQTTIPGYVTARYLVSFTDSVAAHAPELKNPYLEDGKYTKLGFVDAVHGVSDLNIIQNGDTIKTYELTDAVKKSSLNPVEFAFRIVDRTTEDFIIESTELKDGAYVTAYVRWQNGVPVLTQDITDAEVFNVRETALNPTANEEISAEASAISVIATDGAVIVKGAEGKNVIVSTILGKVVANETVNSDNETIAAPAGIVVVSVDGESFKVAVK